jgi:hypothetical protein
MQYKGFPLATLETMRAGYKAMGGGAAGLSLMVGTTVSAASLAMVGIALQSIATGKAPPDPTDLKVMMMALAKGGTAGLYGDFLLGEYDSYGKSFAKDLAGPVLGQISDAAGILAGLRDPDAKKNQAAMKAFQLVINNAPGRNLFYTKAALDYMIISRIQDTISPGFTSRMYSKLRQEEALGGGRRDYLFLNPARRNQ